ncbi:hypothetical protein ACP4OV_008714 [Aristida adscensionis]
MDLLGMSLPSTFRLLFRTDDHDEWPPEAALLLAAHHGNVGRIKEIARRLDVDGSGVGPTLRRTTCKGLNVLHAAAGGEGKLPVCRYLVEEVRMDVNKRDTTNGRNKTPLEHAVFGGNLPVVRYLLAHGADLHQESHVEGQEGITALHAAAEKGRCEIAKFLISRGAHVDGKSCRMTPLHFAIAGGHDNILKILLEHHADPNKVIVQSTPVDIALRVPSLSCLKLLIEAGAELNGNPLAKAAQRGLTEAMKCLLEAGANPNIPDICGRMPIEVAALFGTREEVEVLFPFTSPIPTVANWSVDGIIDHIKIETKQLEDDDFVEMRKAELTKQAGDAYKRQDYISASDFYTQALRVDLYDANLFSKRSICWLRTGDGNRALQDAEMCQILRPMWPKAYYQKGKALMLLKKYKKACKVLSRGLELDPENDEIDRLYWEAMELKNVGTVET